MSAEPTDAQDAQIKQDVAPEQAAETVTATGAEASNGDTSADADADADAEADEDNGVDFKPEAEDATQLAQPAQVPKATETQQQKQQESELQPVQTSSSSTQPLQPLKYMSVEQRRQIFEERIRIEPRDGEAWLALIEEAQSREDMQATRTLYDRFFKVFPNQGRQWLAYLDLELAHSNFAQVEAIFTRCLRTTPSVDLWKFYLSYTRRVNPLPPSTGAEEDAPREQARRVLEGAYEFALRFIGSDKDSGQIWTDYIALIKEREAKGGWKEGQKMDDLRRVYQRAVSVPLSNIEAIWKDYDSYENGLNKLTAKKFLAERSPAYMTARRVLRDLKAYTDHLVKPLLPRVPVWTTSAIPGDAGEDPAQWQRERQQVEAWTEYLKWEESNPLLLEDAAALQARITSAYRKATMYLRFYPEVWYLASRYLISTSRQDEAATWLKNGMEACTGSFLLHFAYVELAEARKATTDCAGVFDGLLSHIHAQIDARQTKLQQDLKNVDTEAEMAKAQAASRRAHDGDGDVDVDGEERERERQAGEQLQARKQALSAEANPEIEGLKEASSLVWIKYMHFLRRTEGIRPARSVFSRARKSPHCTWQIFEASALMEYHCSKEPVVATKVFELALKTFGNDEAFVVRYLDFLISMNDDSNARALFERVIGTFTPERARPIWDRWAKYEYNFGDSVAIQKLEARLAETYPEEQAIKRFVARSSYMDLDLVGPRDLGVQPMIVGGSAADRAVVAAKEATSDEGPRRRTMQEMKRLAADSVQDDTSGNWARPGASSAAAASLAGGPPTKKFKRDSASPAPTSGGAGGGFGKAPPLASSQAATQIATEYPDAVLVFMEMLPSANLFDGPIFKPEDIMDCLRSANLPMSGIGGRRPQPPGQQYGSGGAGRGRFMR
ncbi:related to RNA14 - component of pre-mRNA 3`-end processing factor CF I [Ustilago trichophora]|uniref:mRNA 3'-end-processing protein RNA14 n=1 Tax=Ustilago trichophora TaxID=86804 RepID=A0A5C3EAQ2_9BASI|nr:related to RNA14 - component of pre-mRNA 3`-end processing factor CF I [Ustilago trichophora]